MRSMWIIVADGSWDHAPSDAWVKSNIRSISQEFKAFDILLDVEDVIFMWRHKPNGEVFAYVRLDFIDPT